MVIDLMKRAVKEAFIGMRKGHGGPFGAVVTRNGKIIASAHNEVLKTNDPTMHAEINAIRKASKKLKRFDLSDCVLYTSCEPCPMCFSAIEWARINTIYYGCTIKDAEKIGFSDEDIFDDIKRSRKKRKLNEIRICNDEIRAPFREWSEKKNKRLY
jgi:guanine deaminase